MKSYICTWLLLYAQLLLFIKKQTTLNLAAWKTNFTKSEGEKNHLKEKGWGEIQIINNSIFSRKALGEEAWLIRTSDMGLTRDVSIETILSLLFQLESFTKAALFAPVFTAVTTSLLLLPRSLWTGIHYSLNLKPKHKIINRFCVSCLAPAKGSAFLKSNRTAGYSQSVEDFHTGWNKSAAPSV